MSSIKNKRYSRRIVKVTKHKKKQDDTQQDNNQNNQQHDNVINILDNLITNHKKQINKLKFIKRIYYKDVRNSTKMKKRREKKTGFAMKNIVPDKIADFLHINKGVEMSRPEVTKRIYQELKNRNLCYEEDRRVLRVDDDICDMFNLTTEVNNSTDPKDVNGFNFYNLQKNIADCYKNNK